MTYEIILSNEFVSRIEKLPKNLQKGVLSKIEILKEHAEYGKPLHAGLKGLWELKLGKLRIFYTIDFGHKIIRIVTAEFRGKLF